MPRLFSSFSKDDREAFLGSVRDKTGRKKEAEKRVKVAAESFSDLVKNRIDEVYTDPTVKRELMKFAELSYLNPLKNVTDRLGVAYKNPPTRTLEGAATEEDNKKFQRLLRDGRIGIEAKDWLKWTLVTNVVIVVPRILDRVRPRLKWEMFLPHEVEVITTLDDASEVEIVGYQLRNDWVCVLDAFAWTTYDENDKQVAQEIHDLDLFPGTVFRLSKPIVDFWSSTVGTSMLSATIEIGHLMAVMAWVRKGQNRKGLFLAAENLSEAVAEGQLLLAEKPVEINAHPNEFKFNVEDMVTSIKDFEDHIRFLYREVSEQAGLPSYITDLANSAGAEPNNATSQVQGQAKLAEIRENHIQFLRYSEEELMEKTVRMAKAKGHLDAVDPQLVMDTFKIVWPPQSFVDDPQRKLDTIKKRIELNVGYSQVDAVMELYPGITREGAAALIQRGIEERAIVASFHAANNLPAEANLGTVAQVNGAMGGAESPPSEPDDEEDEGEVV